MGRIDQRFPSANSGTLCRVRLSEWLGLAVLIVLSIKVLAMSTDKLVEDWLCDLLYNWQDEGVRYFPEEVVRQIKEHLVLKPKALLPNGSRLLPDVADSLSEMETRRKTVRPF